MKKNLTLAEAKTMLGNEHVFETQTAFRVCDHGKYRPGVTFVIPKSFELATDGKPVSPICYLADSEVTGNMNVAFNGAPSFMFGDFWRSKKGSPHFTVKSPEQAKHLLIKVSWGGAFNDSRGQSESFACSLPGVEYFRRARSNGGGAGNDYWVVPVGWYQILVDEEIDEGIDSPSVSNEELWAERAKTYRSRFAQKLREESQKRDADLHARLEAEEASRKRREEFLPRLEEIRVELENLHKPQASGARYGIEEMTLGEAYFNARYEKCLYCEEGLEKAEAYLAHVRGWVSEEETKRKAKADQRAAFIPTFEALRPKVEGFGWELILGNENAQVKDPAKPSGWGCNNPKPYSFSQEGVDALRAALATEDDRRAKEARKAAQAELEEQGQAAGLPSNVRIWHRAGATNAGQGWVIRPDGTDRPEDAIEGNSRRISRYREGDYIWRQICPGELVLQWAKAYTAAEHEFTVIYAPAKITEAQLERVAEIQDDIEESWKGRTGLASGKVSPPVGQGWGLFPRKVSEFGVMPTADTPEPVASSEAEPVKEEGIDLSSPMAKAFMAALAKKK